MKTRIDKMLLTLPVRQGLAAFMSIHATFAIACCEVGTQLEAEDVADIAAYTTSVYNDLKALGCNDSDRAASGACTGDIYATWSNVRALVHTANELSGTGQGPTEFSLGTDADGLIAALRWNAGEEFSSQEDLSATASNKQQSNLSSRITALRSGSLGFSVNGYPSNTTSFAGTHHQTGLNAGDEVFSRLGGFINASYSYGNLDPSTRENAFDIDGQEINAGLDYRLDNNWIVGGMAAYVSENIDFDSSQSIVDGTVDMTAIAITPFLLYQSETWYYSLSVGYQTSEFDTNRSVRYTSLNVDIPSPDTVAISNNTGSTLSASFSGARTFQVTDRFSIDPSVTINYQELTIDGFTERDISNDGFNLKVLEQNFESLETTLALKMQYVFSNTFGVFTPFADIQAITQHYADARRINAVYANIADTVNEEVQMSLLTDKLDSEFGSVGLGVAAVLRGASQQRLDSTASGGVQAYLGYRELIEAGNFHQSIISGGLRYEF